MVWSARGEGQKGRGLGCRRGVGEGQGGAAFGAEGGGEGGEGERWRLRQPQRHSQTLTV